MREFDKLIFDTPVVEKVTFYADNGQYRNKLFTFKASDYISAFNLVCYFKKQGNHFRSIYIKGYTRHHDEFVPFQQTANQEFMSMINSNFEPTFPKFFSSFF